MLNVFKKNKDQARVRTYRCAQIREDTGELVDFKYFLLDREQIDKADFLRGIEMQESTKVIGTYSSYKFNTKTKIIIGGVQYSVNSIYNEQQTIDNGIYRNSVKQERYLILKR